MKYINLKFYGERHGCVLSFVYLQYNVNLSVVFIYSLKLIFLCEVFVGISDRIQCYFFWPGKQQRFESAH